MKPIGVHNYFVYILTNKHKTVLYTGVTNNLAKRLYLHKLDAQTKKIHFTGKYNVVYLIYWERFQYIQHAILREKQIKGLMREKKEKLISDFNPDWNFLNKEIEE
jgi:putative endonuclease